MKPMKRDPFGQSHEILHPLPAKATLTKIAHEESSQSTPATIDNDTQTKNGESAVMLIDEVAAKLRISRNQIQRLEKRGAFPIPRLPKLDRHPRYARSLIERFLAGHDPSSLIKRRRR